MLSKSMASLVKSSLLAVAFFVSGAFSSESATRIYHHPNHGKWGKTNTNTRSPAFVPLRTLKNTAFSVGSNNGHQTKVASPRGRSYQSLPKHHVNPRQQSMGTLLSSPLSDTITSESNISNSSGSAEDVAQQLREKARALRLEATAAEQTLRNSVQIKKDAVKKEADEMINLLLGSTTTDADAAEESAKGNGGASTSPSISISNSIPTAQTLALRIEEHKLFSPSKLQKVVERLHERETSMMMGPEGYLSKEETSMDGETKGGEFVLGDYENNSVEYKKEETDRISGLLDRVLEAVQILDEKGLSGSSSSVSTAELSENGKLSSGGLGSKLRIRVADLRQSRDALLKRRVDTLASSSSTGSKQDGSIDGYIQSSIDGDDENQKNDKKRKQEKMLARLLELPTWLPPSLGAFAATSPVEVSVKHWKMIKTDLLTDSEFICTSWDGTDVAAIFRGRLPRASLLRSRSSSSPDTDKEEGEDENNSITVIFEDLQARLENHAELNKRVRLFLVDDYEWRPAFVTGDYGSEDDSPPPVIIALAKEVEPEQESERGLGTKSLAVFSTLATLFTTLAYSLSAFALNPTFFNSVVKENDISAVPLCLPIFAGVLAMSVLHELGHFVVAKMNGVKLGLPVPLPSLQVGTFGSITPLRSFPKTKQAMFDVAISGPGLSMLVSVILLISGLNLTLGSDSFAEFPVVPAALMKSSFLVGSIVSAIAPKMMLVPLSQPIPVHPMFFVGLAGLVMSAVNLLPIGRLDGGRACMAIWGRRPASLISFLSLLALAIYSFSGVSGTIIFWGALVASTQRLPDIPAVDEVTDVGSLRMKSYILLLALTLLTLAPFPGGALAEFALDF